MARSLFLVPLVAASVMATPAAAEQHEVLILDSGFFPIVTYVDAGDTIEFVNETSGPRYLIGDDNLWVVGPISGGSSATITIPQGMKNYFISADSVVDFEDYNGEDQPTAPRGIVNFGTPPLG
ncbi:MAG: hypothetical protein AAGM84_11945 [Pseudomonadota bacterium]